MTTLRLISHPLATKPLRRRASKLMLLVNNWSQLLKLPMLRPRRPVALRTLPSHLTWLSRPMLPRIPSSIHGLSLSSRTTLTPTDLMFPKAQPRTSWLPGLATSETTSNMAQLLLKALSGLSSRGVLNGSWINSALAWPLVASKLRLQVTLLRRVPHMPPTALLSKPRRLVTKSRRSCNPLSSCFENEGEEAQNYELRDRREHS